MYKYIHVVKFIEINVVLFHSGNTYAIDKFVRYICIIIFFSLLHFVKWCLKFPLSSLQAVEHAIDGVQVPVEFRFAD